MTARTPTSVRRTFLASLLDGIRVTWPVLSSLLVLQVALGVIVGVAALAVRALQATADTQEADLEASDVDAIRLKRQ